jgi:sulfatase modifying factor 1
MKQILKKIHAYVTFLEADTMKKKSLMTILVLASFMIFGCLPGGSGRSSSSGDSSGSGGIDAVTNADIIVDSSSAITGVVVDRGGVPIQEATVSAYGVIVETDSSGEFILNVSGSLPNRVLIHVEKEGFFSQTSAALSPPSGGPRLRVALTERKLVTQFPNAEGGSFLEGPLSGEFAEDSFAETEGEVSIYVGVIEAEDDDIGAAFPGGDFAAEDSEGDDGTLVSFGAFQVEAESADGSSVDLSVEARFCMSIPQSMLESAPEEMPFWLLRQSDGVWQEAGAAIRDGDRYCFFLSTLGTTNLDLFFGTAFVTGQVCDDNKDPLMSVVEVRVGQASVYTDDSGIYFSTGPLGTPIQFSTEYASVNATLKPGENVVDIGCTDTVVEDIAGTYLWISPGTFTMGSPIDELGRNSEEVQHEVTLTRGFWLKETEVTQGEWEALMGNNPSHFSSCGTTCPVEYVSWWDAVAYCNALSSAQSLTSCYTLSGCSGTPGVAGYTCSSITQVASCTGYRLPTEAEWEYAYRAGTTTAFYNGAITGQVVDPNLELIGWYGANSGSQTKPVAGKTANAWGLYDMSGNVYEWVWDWYLYGDYGSTPQLDPSGPPSGDYRTIRGGGWDFTARGCRAASRDDGPLSLNFAVGFRPARSF